ncbi:MAG: recombination mediator RecR [Pseudomonadales bacterium]
MNEGLIEQLIDAFRCLPGVGRKSAQRMVWHLLERDRAGGQQLAGVLAQALKDVGECGLCRNFTEAALCALCDDPQRDRSLLCIVESPADVMALEQSGSFRGCYFLTQGNLSPIDGIGPAEIGAEALVTRCGADVKEVIFALDSTVEGEATRHFLSERLRPLGLTISRIAHGIPMGGELEFVDGGTLAHAMQGRKPL